MRVLWWLGANRCPTCHSMWKQDKTVAEAGLELPYFRCVGLPVLFFMPGNFNCAFTADLQVSGSPKSYPSYTEFPYLLICAHKAWCFQEASKAAYESEGLHVMGLTLLGAVGWTCLAFLPVVLCVSSELGTSRTPPGSVLEVPFQSVRCIKTHLMKFLISGWMAVGLVREE